MRSQRSKTWSSWLPSQPHLLVGMSSGLGNMPSKLGLGRQPNDWRRRLQMRMLSGAGQSEETLIVVSTFHSVATALGLTAKSAPMDDRRSLVISKLAVAPAVRGAAWRSSVSSQARAVGLLSLAIEKLQQSAMQRAVEPSTPVEDEPLDSEINRTSRVARLAWQWDETYYELLECRGTSIVGSERARRSHQIMMHKVAICVLGM